MKEINKYEAVLVTFCEALNGYVIEAQKERNINKNNPFYSGYILGFHRVITLLQQQAEIFELPLSKINMDTINEQDLL